MHSPVPMGQVRLKQGLQAMPSPTTVLPKQEMPEQNQQRGVSSFLWMPTLFQVLK